MKKKLKERKTPRCKHLTAADFSGNICNSKATSTTEKARQKR